MTRINHDLEFFMPSAFPRRLLLLPEFASLSMTAKMAFLYLIASPFGSPNGLYHARVDELAPLSGVGVEAFRRGMRECDMAHFIEMDEDAGLVRIRNVFRWNRPSNPNMLQNWLRYWHKLPASPIKQAHREALLKAARGWGDGFHRVAERMTRDPVDEPDAEPGQGARPGESARRSQNVGVEAGERASSEPGQDAPDASRDEPQSAPPEAPDWLDTDLWRRYCEARARMGAPLDESSGGEILATLTNWKTRYQIPVNAIENAIRDAISYGYKRIPNPLERNGGGIPVWDDAPSAPPEPPRRQLTPEEEAEADRKIREIETRRAERAAAREKARGAAPASGPAPKLALGRVKHGAATT